MFFSKANRTELLTEFGLRPELPTVLLHGRVSFGVTNISLNLQGPCRRKALPFQIIIITGRNKRLYRTVPQADPPLAQESRSSSFSRTAVADYMHACDLLVTKPGGLTVSEALACSIPLAVFDAIPGQEEDNANFLIAHNMAIPLDSRGGASAAIVSLLEDSAPSRADARLLRCVR